MHDMRAVRVGEGVSNLYGVPYDLGRRLGATHHPIVHGLAFEVLHDEEWPAILVANIEQRADVRMAQRGDGARFALESRATVGTLGQIPREQLDGDRAIEASLASFVDLAHTAHADERQDLVGAQPGAD
jgi:hypothetical protein